MAAVKYAIVVSLEPARQPWNQEREWKRAREWAEVNDSESANRTPVARNGIDVQVLLVHLSVSCSSSLDHNLGLIWKEHSDGIMCGEEE